MLWGGSETLSFGPVFLLCRVQKRFTSVSSIWMAAQDHASFSSTSRTQEPPSETSAHYVILSVEPPYETWLSLRRHQQSRSNRPQHQPRRPHIAYQLWSPSLSATMFVLRDNRKVRLTRGEGNYVRAPGTFVLRSMCIWHSSFISTVNPFITNSYKIPC
jgi:hypothetical protein